MWNPFTRKNRAPAANTRSLWNRMSGKITATRNVKKARSGSATALLEAARVNQYENVKLSGQRLSGTNAENNIMKRIRSGNGKTLSKHMRGLEKVSNNRQRLHHLASGALQRAEEGNFNSAQNKIDEVEISNINNRIKQFEEDFKAIDMKAKILKLNDGIEQLKKDIPKDEIHTIEVSAKKTASYITELLTKYKAYFLKDKALFERLAKAIVQAMEVGSIDNIEDPMIKELMIFFIPIIIIILPTIGRVYRGMNIEEVQEAFIELNINITNRIQNGGGYTVKQMEELWNEREKVREYLYTKVNRDRLNTTYKAATLITLIIAVLIVVTGQLYLFAALWVPALCAIAYRKYLGKKYKKRKEHLSRTTPVKLSEWAQQSGFNSDFDFMNQYKDFMRKVEDAKRRGINTSRSDFMDIYNRQIAKEESERPKVTENPLRGVYTGYSGGPEALLLSAAVGSAASGFASLIF